MRFIVLLSGLLASTTSLTGCSGIDTGEETVYEEAAVAEMAAVAETGAGESDFITVQHCLIAFQGTGTRATRTKADAEKLALELYEQANRGDDFAAIIRNNTDDSPPGIYKMANRGFTGEQGVYARDSMVPAFGDTGFPLKVGEYGLAPYDPRSSPFGWHIVKRIQ